MNRKLIAVLAATTMAGAAGFSAIASAEATVYGRVVAGAVYTDGDESGDDGAWNFGAVGKDGAKNGFASSRFGFKGETDLGNGSSAGFKIEREIDGDNDTSQRHNLIYLSGSWGKLTLGNQSNPYMNARNWDQTYFNGGVYGHGEDYRHEGIGYSMSSGPFSLNILAQARTDNVAGGDDVQAASTKGADVADIIATSRANVTVATAETASDDSDGIDGWIIHAGYDLGVVNINVAHHATNKEVKATEAKATNPPGGTQPAAGVLEMAHTDGTKAVDAAGASRDNTAIGFSGSVGSMMNWHLAYQTSELNTNAYENDVDSIGGALTFNVTERDTFYVYHVKHSADRASYTKNDDKVVEDALGEDYSESIIGYARNIGPGINFIAEYQETDDGLDGAGSEPSILALAIKLDF